jgi:hypothetical protein
MPTSEETTYVELRVAAPDYGAARARDHALTL